MPRKYLKFPTSHVDDPACMPSINYHVLFVSLPTYLLVPAEEQVVVLRIGELVHPPLPQLMRDLLAKLLTHRPHRGLPSLLLSPPGGLGTTRD